MADNNMPAGCGRALFLIFMNHPSLYIPFIPYEPSSSFMPLPPSISVHLPDRGQDITHFIFLTCCHLATRVGDVKLRLWQVLMLNLLTVANVRRTYHILKRLCFWHFPNYLPFESAANFLVDILRVLDEKALKFIIWKMP